MRITVRNIKTFATALDLVARAIGKVKSIYEYMLFKLEGGRVSLSASRGDLGVTIRLPLRVAEGDGDGAFLAPALGEMLRAWNDAVNGDVVHITVIDTDMTMMAGPYTARIPIHGAEDYPFIPSRLFVMGGGAPSSAMVLRVPTDVLVGAMESALFITRVTDIENGGGASSSSYKRWVCFRVHNDRLQMMATDTVALIRQEVGIDRGDDPLATEPISFFCESHTVRFLTTGLEKLKTLFTDETHVEAIVDARAFALRLGDACFYATRGYPHYPDLNTWYRRRTATAENTFVVARADLARALTVLDRFYVPRRERPCHLVWSPRGEGAGLLVLTTHGTTHKANAHLQAQTMHSATLLVDLRYLIPALGAMSAWDDLACEVSEGRLLHLRPLSKDEQRGTCEIVLAAMSLR